MRWGLLGAVAVVSQLGASAGCDNTIDRESNPRYYIAPDSGDGVPVVPGRQDGSVGPIGTPLPDGGTSDAGSSDAGSFDPATLPLSAWWRASYSGSPWASAASAGTSAGQSATEAASPPGVGAQNGLAPADFDGTNDKLTAPGTLGSYFGATYSGWALVNLDVVSTDSAVVYENDGILSTQPSAYWTLFVRGSGVVGIRHVPSGETIVTTPFAAAAWQLVQFRFDGTNVAIRVNGGAWSSAAGVALGAGPLASALVIGTNYASTQFIDGRIADVGLASSVLTDKQLDDVRAYVNARYALTL